MTTGRINQVTSLKLGRFPQGDDAARAAHKGRGFGYEDRGTLARVDPALRTERAGRERHLMTIQLPPLSFPRGIPPRGVFGSKDRPTPLHAPLRWRGPVPGSTPEGGYRLGPSPENLMRIVTIRQPSTDSKGCPLTQGPAGLLFRPANSFSGANHQGLGAYPPQSKQGELPRPGCAR
jgi:hypothetical protein